MELRYDEKPRTKDMTENMTDANAEIINQLVGSEIHSDITNN